MRTFKNIFIDLLENNNQAADAGNFRNCNYPQDGSKHLPMF